MKLDAISRGGRKKDFWDLSEILETHSFDELLEFIKGSINGLKQMML
jgi:hypothetical protein